jgi:hypothetical protein
MVHATAAQDSIPASERSSLLMTAIGTVDLKYVDLEREGKTANFEGNLSGAVTTASLVSDAFNIYYKKFNMIPKVNSTPPHNMTK